MPAKPKPAKPTHGGKRRGAGPPTIGVVRVQITILPADDALAKSLGSGDRSKGIREMAAIVRQVRARGD